MANKVLPMCKEDIELREIPVEKFPFTVPRVIDEFPSVTERYFDARFFKPKEAQLTCDFPAHDQCVLFHSNKLALITLSPEHPVVKNRLIINKIEFENCATSSKVSGKHKKGGHLTKETTVLCKIYCENGQKYNVLSCVRAHLMEINENLVKNPQLIVDKTWSEGYIAIFMPFLRDYEKCKKKLLNYDNYIAALNEIVINNDDNDSLEGKLTKLVQEDNFKEKNLQ